MSERTERNEYGQRGKPAERHERMPKAGRA